MDIRKVKKLIELLEESNIAEIEIKEGEEAVRISRASQHSAPNPVVTAYAPPPVPQINETAATPSAGNTNSQNEALPNGHIIESPMVGTYYEGPAPGSGPFVSIGQTVSMGETLCIIEAMKILNQIESDKSGTIKSILCKNGEPVEYGQPLFVIE